MDVDDETMRRSWWGWGRDSEALTDEECRRLGALVPGLPDDPLPVPRIEDLDLPRPRLEPPSAIASFCDRSDRARAAHTHGKAYRDVVRSLRGELTDPPDVVARPRTEAEVVAVLDWATEADAAVVPFGGGSSVVGGVECSGDGYRGVVSLDLTSLDRVLEIDEISLAARIQAGALGPVLEDQLRPHGLTLRHFPQSFEFSTLGGWLATRAGGHYATVRTHIDDFVESMRVVTPTGVSESNRLPGSGAGPSPDRLFLGSEGTLGVITEAWMRVQRRPEHRSSTSVAFSDRADAFRAVRAVAQSGLDPANCRLLDPGEAALSGASTDGSWILVLGVESAGQPTAATMDLLVELVRDHGGMAEEPTTTGPDDAPRPSSGSGDDAAGRWRSAFLRMPYSRDGLARMSGISETFETATTWDRLDALHDELTESIGTAIREITGSPGLLNCRFTHVYPDGAAPYYTVIAAGRRGSELSMWDEIKAASMEIISRHRATVTHHHAVGRDHRPGYDRQRPEPFARALTAVKATLDPAGILNPGVLLPSPR